MQELTDSYLNDQFANNLIEELQENSDARPPYTLTDGILRYKNKLYIGSNGDWRRKVMQEMHDSATGGHSGILGTYQRTKHLCYWPGLKKDVHAHVSCCDVCQMHKHENIKPPGLLQPIASPEGPWKGICMDFITGLPKSEGKDVILLIVERFTKFSHFIALAHPISAPRVAQEFFEVVYKLHGLPLNIISDRDPIFTSLF